MARLIAVSVQLVLITFLLAACTDDPSSSVPGKSEGQTMLTHDQFTQAYRNTVKQMNPKATTESVAPLQVHVSIGDQEPHHVFLDNAYRNYQAAPEQLDEILARHAKFSLETLVMEPDQTMDIRQIIPIIKDANYPADVRQSLVDAGKDISKFSMYFEPLNSELIVMYALDTEASVRYLIPDDVEKLEKEHGKLRPIAVGNIKHLLPDIEVAGGDGLFMLTAGGTYEASLLLADSIWTKENFDVQGDIVIAVPSRDVLLVTGSDDAANQERIMGYVEQTLKEGSYTLTGQLFVRKDDRWVIFSK